MSEESERRSAREIFEVVEKSAREELERSSSALAFSGLFAGVSMGLSALGVALMTAHLPESTRHELVAMLLYPLGFIAVIIGRGQLFTENTVYPVALVLTDRKHVFNMLRLWTVVFVSNLVGIAAFSGFLTFTSAVDAATVDALGSLGLEKAGAPFWTTFATGIVGGWLIALVAWTVSASRSTLGQILMTWLLTYVVGVGGFAHCIAGSCEVLSAVMSGRVEFSSYLVWLCAATLGNVVGGVLIVTLVNYGQVVGADGKEPHAQAAG